MESSESMKTFSGAIYQKNNLDSFRLLYTLINTNSPTAMKSDSAQNDD